MTKLKKGVFPGIVRQGKQKPADSAMAESIEILTGQRGKGDNRALLVSDLINLDDMKRNALINSANGGTNPGGLPITTGSVEKPHAPVGLTATGGFTFIAVTWEHPTYRGHAYAEVWRSEENTFGSATRIATEVADVFSDSVNMGEKYYYWVRFVNTVDMKGPTQGANGIYAETINSAESILAEIGGKIEGSHLGTFLTSEIGKIPALDFMLGELVDNEIPALKVDVENIGVDIEALRTDVDKNIAEIPSIKGEIEDLSAELPEIKQGITDLTNDTEAARQVAESAKQRVESVEISSDSLARQLIESASINDINWQSNTTKLYEFESSLENVNARIESEFLTKSEANEAIAAAADTIRVEIEATGLALSGDIESTYYTKATTDEAIATATQLIKSEIEDVNGNSIGALLDSQHYTKVQTDSAISFSAEQIKSEIENPTGTSLGALLNSDYYTSVQADNAISAYGQQLKSEIEDPNGNSLGATLKTDYYTRTQADSAISEATTQLGSEVTQEIEGAISTVNSNLTNNYYTSSQADQAIAVASQFLKSQIEDPEGVSLGATLFNDYSTKVDTEQAVSRAIFELDSQFDPLAQSVIENAIANDLANDRQQVITANILQTQEAITSESEALAQSISVIETQFNESSARITELNKAISTEITSSAQKIFQLDSKVDSNKSFLEVNYLTNVDTEEAISQATTALKSEVEFGFNAVLTSEYYTAADTDSAISQASTQLQSNIDDISSGLSLNYYTKTQADEAISQATTILQSAIEDPEGESVAADLYQNYLTSTQTGLAISEATQQLKSAIEDPEGSSLAADVYANFSTKTDTTSAISEATTALKSNIEDPSGNSLGATLFNEYETKADAEQSSAQSTQLLRAEFEPTAKALIEGALDNDLLYERRVVLEAEIISRQNAFADEQQALTESIFALNSSIGESNANIEQLQTTFSTSAQSQAQNLVKLGSDIGNVKSDLVNNYFTSADVNEAIASADTALRAAIEDPDGDSVAADLQVNYYTKAAADSAISQATTQLKSAIEDPEGNSIGADLYVNYLTKTETNQAISAAKTALQSNIDDNQASLTSDYYTKTDANSAISASNQLLRSAIEDSEGDSVGASLQVLGQTVANNQGEYSALWGIKSAVNGLTTSIGLVNDGVEPIFAVKGAKFSIITDQDPTNLTPVFAVSEGKTVINTAIIDEAFIKSLVTDDLLANRLLVGSTLTTPSINYNPVSGARSSNFSIDPGGNMLAKSATLESVTIKDSLGNVVMSSTGAIPSSKVTGLGDLASKDSLGYSELSGRPNLGTFAFLSELGYNDLSGKPTLGSLASKNSLSYNEVTGKPALGSLAYLNSLAYDSVTGKPSLGPFAGLSKILSSNVTTYIANGAIGSAQIDTAYINSLFGQDASFYGTVYAENLSGDVTDTITKPVNLTQISGSQTQIATLNIASATFTRTLYIRKIKVSIPDSGEGGSNQYKSTTLHVRTTSGTSLATNTGQGAEGVEDTTLTINANTTYAISLRVSTNASPITDTFTGTVYPKVSQQDVLFQIFKKGSALG